MKELSEFSTKEIEDELKRRGKIVSPTICPTCKIYKAILSDYSVRPPRLHCVGCMKIVERCTCRR